MVPTARASVAVAAALAATATLFAGSARRWRPGRLHRNGARVAAGVLLARAVGDGRTVGLTKTVRGTAFARNDDRLFTPLCVALGLAGLRAARRGHR
jgi:hypothetical protein